MNMSESNLRRKRLAILLYSVTVAFQRYLPGNISESWQHYYTNGFVRFHALIRILNIPSDLCLNQRQNYRNMIYNYSTVCNYRQFDACGLPALDISPSGNVIYTNATDQRMSHKLRCNALFSIMSVNRQTSEYGFTSVRIKAITQLI